MGVDTPVCGQFEIFKDESGRHRFRLMAGARTLLQSRAYKSRYCCTVGIMALRACAAKAANFTLEPLPGGRERLKLVALNHRVLAVGECTDIALVQRLAAAAPVNDTTISRPPSEPRVSRFRIYAAPRNERGIYQPRDAAALIVRGFESAALRDDYWNRRIRPATRKQPGARYEYVMCDYPDDGCWRFVSERRYSDWKLIKGNL